MNRHIAVLEGAAGAIEASGGLRAFASAKLAPAEPQDVIALVHDLIEGLPEQIALLDDRWNILTINDAWARAIERYGYLDLKAGANYRQFSERLAAEGHSAASLVNAAISRMEGGETLVRVEYDGERLQAGRQFEVCFHRLQLAGRSFVTIARADISELVELRRAREMASRSMLEQQLAERRRFAREIHDSAMQSLVCIGLNLSRLRRGTLEEAPLSIVSEIEELLDEVQREIRSIAFLSHPPELEKLGLVEAIRSLTLGFGRRANLEIAFEAADDLVLPEKAVQLAIYRVVQESLSNIHRHAHAKKAEVRLVSRRSAFHAVIADDGSGLTAATAKGVGVAGMGARLVELRGRLSIVSRGHGTAILASVPYA